MTPSPRRLALALALSCMPLACGGGEEPAPTGKQPRQTPTKQDPLPVASGSTGGDESSGTTDPFEAEGGWEEVEGSTGTGGGSGGSDGGDADPTGGEVDAAPQYIGPCSFSWSGAARLRFQYADDGASGKVRIDGDRDGKSDVCAEFTIADGKTTSIKVDEGCTKKVDFTITPTYDEKSNVGTALYEKPGEPNAMFTMVALPSFSGVAPGYPLYADRPDVKLSTKAGLVRTATVKKPTDGPPLKATFTYDKEGRIKRITEDHDLDGTVDRKYDYRFDDAGNVKSVTLTMGPKGEETKSTGRPSYNCWKPKEEKK